MADATPDERACADRPTSEATAHAVGGRAVGDRRGQLRDADGDARKTLAEQRRST